MNDLEKVSSIMTSIVNIYEELLSVLKDEREYLINLDMENLSKVIELKQYIGLNLKNLEDELKNVLNEYGVENINEFLFMASKQNSIDHIRVTNGKLLELMDKFNKESVVNRMITQESVSFYNSMVNMYMGFVKNQSENYDKDATIGITQRALSVRV